MMPFSPLMHVLSPAGRRARLSVLIMHRVLPEVDPLFPGEPDARWFDAMLGWLKSWFNVLPLDTAVAQLQDGTLPPRAAAISFDDGYADNYQIALPILQKHGLPATVFVATGFLDGGIMWNDAIIEMVRRAEGGRLDLDRFELGCHEIASVSQRRAAIDALIGQIKYLDVAARAELVAQCVAEVGSHLPDNLMMSSDELRRLRQAGICIGAHTVSHPILASLPDDRAREEIGHGKAVLEDLLQEPVTLFAYPNGKPAADYLPEHVAMVRDAGFSAALSTVWGAAGSESDVFQLPRFMPWDRTQLKFGMRLAANLLR
jgi:peptidoglycan/xylan/chitin deacetylase (PgdA/CDA1 family)